MQATISRDIAQLGLVKVRAEDGRLVYALPGAADLDRLSELTAALRRWAISLDSSANLLVIQTPPGHANALAQALDQARLPEVLGTVAGDNTIMVIAREGITGAAIERDYATTSKETHEQERRCSPTRAGWTRAARSRG